MRWQGRGGSGNIEDRRGMGGGGMAAGGGIGAVVIGLIYFLLTGDPSGVQVPAGGGADRQAQSGPVDPATDTLGQFVSTVLRDTEITWGQLFQQSGETYQEPRLVLFRGSTPSACGRGEAAMGPFYCPGDQKVYIDLGFYETMRTRLGAPGDFAQAYVIAHEVGHHVQNLMGISGKVDDMRGRVSEAQQNALSVRLELQADCFAGVWAHHAQNARQILEQGDVEEALNAASQIGDDSLQRKSRGTVQPETFTHGTSAQRVSWFKKGIQTGSVAQCNTFEAKAL